MMKCLRFQFHAGIWGTSSICYTTLKHYTLRFLRIDSKDFKDCKREKNVTVYHRIILDYSIMIEGIIFR